MAYFDDGKGKLYQYALFVTIKLLRKTGLGFRYRSFKVNLSVIIQ